MAPQRHAVVGLNGRWAKYLDVAVRNGLLEISAARPSVAGPDVAGRMWPDLSGRAGWLEWELGKWK
jgi:hypothetical protein